jgi:hypothetical protein
MNYLLLLYGDAEAEDTLGSVELGKIIDAHGEFTKRLREAGAHLHGGPLRPGSAAKTVRRERAVVTDGPFAETKEQLGGFYVISCADDAAALRWAEQVPLSPGLVVEVRPTAQM